VTEFDDDLLPPRSALLDTGVFMRAIGERVDARSALCADLLRRLIERKVRVLVAAPTIAEIIRGNASALPHTTAGIEVVDFDGKAAVLCGELYPAADVAGTADETATKLKFDAMIVACAKRHNAGHLISLDDKMVTRANERELEAHDPHDYLRAERAASVEAPEHDSAPSSIVPMKGKQLSLLDVAPPVPTVFARAQVDATPGAPPTPAVDTEDPDEKTVVSAPTANASASDDGPSIEAPSVLVAALAATPHPAAEARAQVESAAVAGPDVSEDG
jgi:predicted nucleic acid-binding protein